MSLGKRLESAAALVRDGGRVVDVGTDHAYLPIELVLSGRIVSAIACDIGQGPLKNARENVERFGLGGKIELRQCDGLSGVRGNEVDDVVICGMGGELIARILDAAEWTRDKSKNFVLQPMTAADDLRLWLADNGFEVIREVLVSDSGRLYVVMQVVYSGKTYNLPDEYAYIGTVKKSQPYGESYLRRQLSRVEKHLCAIEKTQLTADKERLGAVAEAIRSALNKD